MTIETKFSIGGIAITVPPGQRREMACEVIGVSAHLARRYRDDSEPVERIIRYTLKYRKDPNTVIVFRAEEDRCR